MFFVNNVYLELLKVSIMVLCSSNVSAENIYFG